MATRKGTALAVMIHRLGGGKSWETDGVCSLICRHAATYTRLEEEAAGGPRWAWGSSVDWTARIDVATFQAANDLARELRAARIAALVAELPATEYGAITAELGGDPRGYTVRLLVPTAPGEVTEIGIDEEGARVGSRRVTA